MDSFHDSCHSPCSTDQLYCPTTNSCWPPTYPQSNPTTPDEFDASFFSTRYPAPGHSSTASSGSSIQGSPRTLVSEDVIQFANSVPQSQPFQQHQRQPLYTNTYQSQDLGLGQAHPQVQGHAQAQAHRQPPPPTVVYPLQQQQAPTGYIQAPMYDFFAEAAQAQAAQANWNMQGQGYMHPAQLPMHTYIPPILLSNPAALAAAIAALPPLLQQQLQRGMIWQQAAGYQGAVGNAGEGVGLARSTMSTPSLAGSPVPVQGESSPVLRSSPQTPLSLVSGSMSLMSAEIKRGPKTQSLPSVPSPSRSTPSEGAASPSPVAPLSPPEPQVDIPLRVRVGALPRDKRAMFERATGDLWHPTSTTSAVSDTLTRSELQLLEDLYTLINSRQLHEQLEIPDELVEPILDTLLLPRADAHRGSRGGAAGHVCRWAGCGKVIKRLDHSRNHVREHVKSKPYSCGSALMGFVPPPVAGAPARGCGQRFLRTDDLKRHQKVHCSVLRSGPNRRPRAIRGTRREMDDERDSDVTSLDGGDDDDEYRPVSLSESSVSELASRLRRQRQRSAAVVAAAAVRFVVEDTEESDSSSSPGSAGAGAGVGVGGARLQTSNVRRAVDSPAQSPVGHLLLAQHDDDDDAGVDGFGSAEWVDLLKVWLAYGTLMASCSSQFIIVSIYWTRGLLGKTVR